MKKLAKRIAITVLAVAVMLTAMFIEYRFIMHNLEPLIVQETDIGATIEIAFMGNADVYYADKLVSIENRQN